MRANIKNSAGKADHLTMSGGERQRVIIARAIPAPEPRSCLVHESRPCNLDICHQFDVLDLVKRLSVEEGLTVVIVFPRPPHGH